MIWMRRMGVTRIGLLTRIHIYRTLAFITGYTLHNPFSVAVMIFLFFVCFT